MQTRQLGTVGFAVLGLYLLISALQSACQGVFQVAAFGPHEGWALMTTVSVLALAVPAVIVLTFSARLSRFFLGEDIPDPSGYTLEHLLVWTLAVAGVFLVTESVFGIAWSAEPLLSPPSRSGYPTATLVSQALTGILGLLLFLRAPGIARWYAARQLPEESEEVRS